MRIDQALKSKRFLGAKLGSMETRQTWLAVLKAAYAIPLSVKELALFHSVAGDRPPPTQRVRELWANAGRRSGKTELAAAIGVFHALIAPRKLSKGETGTVLIVAADRAQARVCKDYALAYIKESSELCNDIESETIDEIRLKNGVTISVQANSHKSVRGRAVLCAILDECSFWMSDDSANPDTEVYRAVLPSLITTEGILVGISTPFRKKGLLYEKHNRYFGQPSDEVLVVHGGSSVFNPTLSLERIKQQIEEDPEGGRSEWDAEFRSDDSAYLSDVLIDGAIDYSRPLELPPRPEHRYKCFVDPSGGRHDHYVICLVHKEGDRIVVDVVKGEQPPFDPHSVVQQFAALAREYGITEVTGDNYGANLVQAAWESCGIRYVRSPLNKSQLYIETLPSYTRGIVSIPKHKRLIRELRLLERKPHSGGRDSVDHPRGGTDDYGNALAGALYLCSRQQSEMLTGCGPILIRASGLVSGGPDWLGNDKVRKLRHWRGLENLPPPRRIADGE